MTFERPPLPLCLLLAALLPAAAPAIPETPTAEEAMSEDSMEARCHREVIELHKFFEGWFNGDADTSGDFDRFEDVMAEGFVIVTPEGRAIERQDLVDGLRRARRSWRQDGAEGGRIWIESLRLHHAEGDLALVTYQEWQEVQGVVKGRLSTALFRTRDDTPNGVEWLHVHETWLAGGE